MDSIIPEYKIPHDWHRVAQSMHYNRALFPVDIPAPIETGLLANLQIPGILQKKFTQHSIVRLGQLRGMTPEEFLVWRGFGFASMQALCSLLSSVKAGIIANSPAKPVEFDPALFPVVIPAEIEDELLADLQIPGILRRKFDQHSMTRLGQLRGMTPEAFLSWRGFGRTCMQILCGLLAAAKTGMIEKTQSAKFSALSHNALMPDILSISLEKLNVTSLLRSQLRNKFGIHTVADFLDTFGAGGFSAPGWGTVSLEQVLTEIAALNNLGAGKYLSAVSLDTRSFIEIVSLIKQRLPSRESVIFDHRFFPAEGQFETLDLLGNRFKLTRERVRQLEKGLVRRLQSGTLRELGWLIRRKTLDLFQEGVREMRFEELLANRFLAGVPATNYKGFASFVFLDRVFYSTFKVKTDRVVLNKWIKR